MHADQEQRSNIYVLQMRMRCRIFAVMGAADGTVSCIYQPIKIKISPAKRYIYPLKLSKIAKDRDGTLG